MTQGAVALKSRVDLDGDRRANTLIAAVDRQALLAIAPDGSLLWARAYGFAGLPIKSDVPEPFIANATLPFPGVFDLQDVGDIDADGIVDVLAMLVHYRMAAQTDTCLLIVSGKTGEPIRWVNHSFTATQNVFWPADGIFQPNRDRYRSSGGFSFSGESPHRSGHRYPGDFLCVHDAEAQRCESPFQALPRRPGPDAIAVGLDAWQTPSDSDSSNRAFRRRGGPFGVGDDDLVLMPTAVSPQKRLGESFLVASRCRQGTGRIASTRSAG